jgi:hypothetical protein
LRSLLRSIRTETFLEILESLEMLGKIAEYLKIPFLLTPSSTGLILQEKALTYIKGLLAN